MHEESHIAPHELNAITVRGAEEHNLKKMNVQIERGAITLITGVSGSGKSSLAFDTILAECQRRFFYTLSHYSRQFLDIAARPKVSSISGLSPAIALSQNETMPSRRATVGSLSDASELLGVLFARFATRHCPKHGLETQGGDAKSMSDRLLSERLGETIAIATPIAKSKKGNFGTLLKRFADKGFRQALIDGQLVNLDKIPELAKEEKHTIAIIIDIVKIKEGSEARLLRSLGTALQEGEGFAEYYPTERGLIQAQAGVALALDGGCPRCGFTWPRLDSRHFSRNSLGKCPSCDGYGVTGKGEGEEEDESDDNLSVLDMADLSCQACHGTGYHPELGAVTFAGKSILDYDAMPLSQLKEELTARLASPLGSNAAVKRLLEEVLAQLSRLMDVGLSYLTLSRRIRTLSGGEAQRVRLAGILSENLRGILYVLDEPSQGLHHQELALIWDVLRRLQAQGNTLLLVDHDEFFMRRADWIIDLGPGGGRDGGDLMAKFRPEAAAQFAHLSLTARFLAERAPNELVVWGKSQARPQGRDCLRVVASRLHNLRAASACFALGAFNVVSGVSGAGKSSLVMAVLYENVIQAIHEAKKGKKSWRYCDGLEGYEGISVCHLIDRRPVAKSSVSMPATYLDIFGELRDLYASLPEAQIAGLTARSFSLFHEGGRCENCKGRGQVNLSMRFLADAKEVCPVCQGTRFEARVNEITFQGRSLSEVLNLSLAEVYEHFQHHRKIARRLKPALDMGLGYLILGQPSSSLSGGEAQRLKLIPLLTKNVGAGALVILDEPTTGLHFQDVGRLRTELGKMVANGATVIVIEQHSDIIKAADWLLVLGPGSAHAGGQLVYQGPPPSS